MVGKNSTVTAQSWFTTARFNGFKIQVDSQDHRLVVQLVTSGTTEYLGTSTTGHTPCC